jgi:glyoxylase-like metal-dependent hydrolase (beta-lactamase superfamily II)
MQKPIFINFFLLIFCSILNAQSYPVVAKDSTAFMQKIDNGVYVIIHENATDEWPHGNTGVIIGDDAVFVVDACYLPSRARADIHMIRSITKKPVKYLGITHWHFDHNNGIVAYTDSFPGIQIITERKSADYIEINSKWWARSSAKENSVKKTILAGLEKELAIGKDTVTGVNFSEQEIIKKKKLIAQRKNELYELSNLKVVRANKLFDKEMRVQLGGREVIIKDWGKANSVHDITYFLPSEKILFAGDIIVQAPIPYTFESWPITWIKTLEQIEKMPLKMIVPGHGPVLNDFSYTKLLREFFASAISKAEKALAEGLTLNQLKASADFSEFRKGIWKRSEEAPDEDWETITAALIERAWRSVRGQGAE